MTRFAVTAPTEPMVSLAREETVVIRHTRDLRLLAATEKRLEFFFPRFPPFLGYFRQTKKFRGGVTSVFYLQVPPCSEAKARSEVSDRAKGEPEVRAPW